MLGAWGMYGYWVRWVKRSAMHCWTKVGMGRQSYGSDVWTLMWGFGPEKTMTGDSYGTKRAVPLRIQSGRLSIFVNLLSRLPSTISYAGWRLVERADVEPSAILK